MAKDTFKIEIPVEVKDNTEPGVSSSSEKMSAFDKVVEKAQSRLEKVNGTKWKATIETVDKVTSVISTIGSTVKGFTSKAWSVTLSAVDKVTGVAKGIISTLGKVLSIGTAVSTVLGGLTVADALSAASTQNTVETQLKTVLANVSEAEDAFDRLAEKASSLQQKTMYGDEAYLAGAAELATYLSDTDALETAMEVLSDYAAGMSGGAELSTTEMTDYATQLGKALNGASASFDGLTKKGFTFTDAQKAILQSDLTSDMEKISVLAEVIGESWGGLAESFNNTPTAKITKFKNAFGDIKEVVGNKLYPSVGKFFDMLYEKLPGVQSILEGGADWLNTTLENLIPSISGWIDTAIKKVEEFGDKLSKITSSDEFKNANLFGKVKILWDDLVAAPFSEWWSSTGKQWFAEKASEIGGAIGTGITTGLLALLGIDVSDAVSDGTSIGGAFLDGFKSGFDTEKITEALKQWAEDNKEIVIGIGAIVGFNLITGLASKINSITSLFKGSGSSGSGVSAMTASTVTVNGAVVNVYGSVAQKVASAASAASKVGSVLSSTAALPAASQTLALPAGVSTAAGAAASGGLASAGSWLSNLLQLGSTSSVIGADGTLLAVQGGLGGTLGSVGGALGSTATTAAGAAAAGVAGGAGILGGIAGLISAGVDLFQGIGKSKEGDAKGAKDEYVTAGTKAGMVAAGAGIGAAVGSVVPVIGTGIGAAVGAGVGGIASLVGGNKAGKAISDSTDDGGWLNNAWQSTKKFFQEDLGKFFTQTIPNGWNKLWGGVSDFFTNSIPQWWGNLKESVSTFFTETIPEKWGELWDGVGEFFTEDVPYAIGYACGKIEIFFTETVPGFFGDLWDGISNFFTETLPTWASGIWDDHIVPFFTESVPEFFSNLWSNVATFFTETIPTWASDVWSNRIVPFFTESIPQFFTNLWSNITTFFTETIPTWASTTWNDRIVPFFTEDIPQFFSDLWDGVSTFFTETIPTWASGIWNNNIVPFFTESIPGFFSNLWSGVTGFFTETLPNIASTVWGSIKGFFTETIPGFLGGIWDNVTGFFGGVWDSVSGAFSSGYADATSKHAWGGIMNTPHMGMVAEDGAEAIIPLSPSKSARGLDLWMKTGRLLGVQPYADGGIVGDTQEAVTTQTSRNETGGTPAQVKVEIEMRPEFRIEGDDLDEESIVAIIKAHIREMADDLSDELAEKLARAFANMPLKGSA